MKFFIVLFSLSLFSSIAGASEIANFLEINEMGGKTIELRQDVVMDAHMGG